MKLLVIDDQKEVCEIIAEVLAQDGWQSVHRSSSHGIAELIRQEKVDVLLIDYLMPEQLGLDVVESLRHEGFDLPIILFSGDTRAIDRARATRLGIMSILDKPMRVAQLRATLKEAQALCRKKSIAST